MEVAIFKFLTDSFGPLGLIVGILVMILIWMYKNQSEVKKKVKELDDVKDHLLSEYRDIVQDNTRAIDQARLTDHADNMEMAKLLQHISTVLDMLSRNKG